MSQGVSQRSHTAVARIKSQASAYEICGGWSATGIGYSPSTSIFPFSIIPPILHNHLHIRVARKKKRKKENCRQAGSSKSLFFLPRKRATLDRKVLPIGQFPSERICCATYIEVCGALNTTRQRNWNLFHIWACIYFSWNTMTRTVKAKQSRYRPGVAQRVPGS